MRLNVGDLVVRPPYGVGVVKGIENEEVKGRIVSYYVIEITAEDIIIKIPTNRVEKSKIRPISSKEEYRKARKLLRRKKPVKGSILRNWKKRYTYFLQKLREGSLCSVAELISELNWLRDNKGLTSRERELYEEAWRLLVQEVSCIVNEREAKVEKRLLKLVTS